MMKALEQLVVTYEHRTIGNHAVIPTNGIAYQRSFNDKGAVEVTPILGITRRFTYHGNTICLVDDEMQRIILTHAGWYTSSTSRALNDYKRYFVDRFGYQIIEED